MLHTLVKLTKRLLDAALSAVTHHGYGSFFPEPPELQCVRKKWSHIKQELAEIDLDTYDGHDAVRAFAPKSRLNVRSVTLLHPYDLILYTALVLALRDGISASRLPPVRVFSYRAEGAPPSRLYSPSPSWRDFRSCVIQRISDNPAGFVGIADVADFYPRIYQHRLINALEDVSRRAHTSYVRALEKLLSRFSKGASYGIPVGPFASRPLGEAVLIDVDSALISFGVDFIRFVDDFVVFGQNPETTEYGLRILGETLFLNHGLTLQTAKTKVLPASDYLERYLTPHDEKEQNRRKLLNIFGEDEYDVVSYDELDDEQKKEIDAFNLSEMLKEALGEGENVDYKEVAFLLGRLSALQKPELIPTVLENLERLYPVADSVAAFFKEFSELDHTTRKEAAQALLAPILNPRGPRPSEFYSIWVLSIFQHQREWNHADDLLRIFRETSSDAVRRFAALALAQCGSRPQAVAMKDYLGVDPHFAEQRCYSQQLS